MGYFLPDEPDPDMIEAINRTHRLVDAASLLELPCVQLDYLAGEESVDTFEAKKLDQNVIASNRCSV